MPTRRRPAAGPQESPAGRLRLARALSLALLALAILLGTLAQGRASPAAGTAPRNVAAEISFLRDPSAGLGLAEIRRLADAGAFRRADLAGRSREERLNFGMTRDAVWLRVPLRNDSARNAERLVEIDYPYLDDVEFHVPDGLPGGPAEVLTGDRRPFSSRGFEHRNFVLPVSLAPGESTEVFIRVRSSAAIQLPVHVRSAGEFAAVEQVRLLLLGSYFGVALVMVLYNLALGRALRDPAYPSYVAFVGLFALFHFSLNGFGYQYLFPASPHLGNHGAYLFLGPAVAAALQFARAFLGSRARMPRLDRFAALLILPLVAMSPAAALFDATWVARTSQALALSGSALGLAMGILAWRLGYTPARLYVLAFVTVILTGVAMVMRNLGFLPWTPLTAYGTQIGASLEALFLGLALADRIRSVQAAALDASRRAEQGLEHEVAARTAELAAANGRLREEIRERERAEARLRESEERLRRLAQHDALTGVANRNLLGDRGGAILASAQRHGRPFGVVAIDLDGLKGVNDAMGHGAGDRLLVACARRLGARLRRSDLLARTGGDEFVILLPDVGGRAELARVAAQLRESFEQPLSLVDGMVMPRASFGTALFPEDGADLDRLIAHADLEMYRDKQARRAISEA
ncbi:MAG: 7TM diverse intracellular signaling domain-containing protein [Gammaproteobacteria bacterium]